MDRKKRVDIDTALSKLEEMYSLIYEMQRQHSGQYAKVLQEIVSTFRTIRNEHPEVTSRFFKPSLTEEELFDEARNLVIEAGKASTSYLQRMLNIGYGRAANLIDMLEKEGVIGPAFGAYPREVFPSSKVNKAVEMTLKDMASQIKKQHKKSK